MADVWVGVAGTGLIGIHFLRIASQCMTQYSLVGVAAGGNRLRILRTA